MGAAAEASASGPARNPGAARTSGASGNPGASDASRASGPDSSHDSGHNSGTAIGGNGSAGRNSSAGPNSEPGSADSTRASGSARSRGSPDPSGASCGESPVGGAAADANAPGKQAGASTFLQLLTKTAAGAQPDSRIDPKTVDPGSRDRPATNDAAPADPGSLIAALALLCPAPSIMANPTPASAASGDSASAPGAGTAAAAIGGPEAGPTSPAQTTGSDALSTQDLMALLTADAAPDGASGTAQAAAAATTDSSSRGSAGAAADANAGPNSPASNPLLGAMAHFAVHHAAPESPRADVKSPVGTSAWADELGGKITWMAHQGIESASLRLSPEHLGPVEVQISVQSGATSVVFGAAHTDTRAALEQALPQLRAMFASQGLTLTDAGVSREPPKQAPRSARTGAISAVSPVSEASVSGSAPVRLRLGLLDTYA